MVIYGVAFLAGCMIVGLFLGELLGALIGVHANVGGVGIAMLVMILVLWQCSLQLLHKELLEVRKHGSSNSKANLEALVDERLKRGPFSCHLRFRHLVYPNIAERDSVERNQQPEAF